ncbi:MAG: LexA family transcriptional regulator [Bacteroidota bacterium]|jgi:transcriptional regulator with XRE-family HTH domain|nr:LexA family transcriptional regulator [Bacteroidota bacterium]
MYFDSNIKFLRGRKKLTQGQLSIALGINRSTLNNYENGISGPSIQSLVLLSDYFHVAIDTLLRVDLANLRESQLYELEHGQDIFLKGSNLRVMATTVDRQNRDNIELVSEKAKAGYTNGFSDPEFISELPVFQLPFLSAERKYRTFQINGDSMLPIPDGAWITGEFVQDWNEIKSGELYVILTLNEGLVFKQLRNELAEHGHLQLISLNPAYQPYQLGAIEIREVWKFVHCISREVPETPLSGSQVAMQLKILTEEIHGLKQIIENQ